MVGLRSVLLTREGLCASRGTSQRTHCGVVLTAFAGALPDLVGQPCAEQMGDAAQPRRRRRAAPRRTLSEQRKKPRTAAPAPAPVVEEAAAAEEAAPATVDEEVAEAVPAPAPAPGGEEPPQLREGGYAFENSTGRMVMVRLVKGLRERNGNEWWTVQPLGGGSPRTVGRFRLVPCAPPAPRR